MTGILNPPQRALSDWLGHRMHVNKGQVGPSQAVMVAKLFSFPGVICRIPECPWVAFHDLQEIAAAPASMARRSVTRDCLIPLSSGFG